jgi:PAS domain S-box-containing protein
MWKSRPSWKPRPSGRTGPSAISRYAIAVLSVALAIAAAELLTKLLHTEPIVSSMLCAVIFAAWFGGFGPGLLAIGLSVLAVHYYLVPPINSFALKQDIFSFDVAELPRLALFALTSFFVNFIISSQRSAKAAALQAEAKAARAEREIRLVTDTVPALVWRALPDGAGEYFNQRWLAYTGLTLEQARGWGFIEAYHPEDRARVRNLTAPGASADELQAEVRLRGVDGKYRWFLRRAVALRDEFGNIVSWYGTTIDIEDRKHAEDAVRRQEAYLAEAQRLSVTGSFGWTVSSGDIFWSEETYRIFGIDRTLKPTLDLALQRVHPDDRDLMRGELRRVARSNHDLDVEHRLLMPDGLLKYLHVRSRRVKSYSGDEEIVGAVIDITAAKEAQEALRAAQAELAHVTRVTTLGEISASIAHEVNQPLGAIKADAEAGLQWLSRGTPDVGEVADSLKRIIADATRASGVIKKIRTLSKNTQPEMLAFDLNEVIDEVATLVRREALNHRVTLRQQLAPNLPMVRGDRIQLQQVIINLVVNGIQAMEMIDDREAVLLIRTQRPQPDQVLLAVEDAGVGMKPENLDQLFRAFYTTKPNGLGMGLSICRSIIEAHGGRIWASPNAGPGMTFCFTLAMDGTRPPAVPADEPTARH